MEKQILMDGGVEEIRSELLGVRFKNNKSRYIVEARRMLSEGGTVFLRSKIKKFANVLDCREWFAENVLGIGYKEASHFLRNIGLGEELTILDRHILKNLLKYNVISEVPRSLTRSRYMDIEKRMKNFSASIDIPVAHLDLLFWCRETGEIFK
jgi:N-glycosylase/DNA lyase